ncbi:MAG: putative 4-hydroxybenzoate polyprenyltransferase [Acidobacteria bacterium]|nr:putative 4-hydroxybenzoate polyprenyltransferase [Acidobacteriota bacterium]
MPSVTTTPHHYGRLGETLTMVRFSHTLFAMPFALTGMLLAAGGLPRLEVCGWILIAMLAARTAAMTFNRLMDRHLDAGNPRTANRSLPAGRLTPLFAGGVFAVSLILLLLAAWRLNPLALQLAPLALVIICGYSLTKRFTSLSHLVLGLSLAGAPLGAWIAVRGDVRLEPLLLATAVLFWTAGFDVIYALQDEQFDRSAGLHSLPVLLGPGQALIMARLFHLLTVILLFALGRVATLGWFYTAAVMGSAMLLIVEHRLVSAADLSRMQMAFFRLNVALGLIVLAGTGVDLLWA